MPKRPKHQEVTDAIAALDGVRREWLRRPGVTAVDVGFKIKDREVTDTVALRRTVRRTRRSCSTTQSMGSRRSIAWVSWIR